MASYNRIVLLGNLTRDPELKYTPTGKAVCDFDLAMNISFKDSKGEKKEEVTFMPISIWGKQAELTAEYMKKGRQCLIEGSIRQEKWVDKHDQNRVSYKVVANMIRFLGKPADKSPKQDEPAPTSAQE